MKFRAISIVMPLAWPNLKQLLRIMKLSTLLLIIGLLQASAKGYSQVTLNERHSPLEKVLQKIEKQTNYIFIYDEDKLKLENIDVTVNGVSVEKALDACFKDLQITYAIVGNNIILKPVVPSFLDKVKDMFSGSITIRGIVTDTAGIPLNRATVFFVKKKHPTSVVTTSSANSASPAAAYSGEITYVTNESGLFYMDAEEGDEMGVSYVGYQTYKFTVKKNMPFLNVVLHSALAQIKEVVVQTGYQTLSKERATGSFSKPDMKIFANRSSTLDVIGRLDGQIPGLTVLQDVTSNYTTGSSTQRALVRGSSSVALGTEPLYVVDGVAVSDFKTINVDDIADITVLKDASAAAIWGAQAANGVVVVVTKTGAKNQKVKFSYQGFIDFEGKPNLNYQRYLTSAQYIQAAKEIFDPVAYPYSSLYYNQLVAPHEQIMYDQLSGKITSAQANAGLDSLSRINNKQQVKDLFYRNAITTNHTLSASGGNNAYSFYASIGYTDVHSTTPGQTNNSYRININQTYNPTKRLSLSLGTQLADAISTGKNAASIDGATLPYQLFKDAKGNNINVPYAFGMSEEQRANYQALSQIDLSNYSPFDEINYAHSSSNNLSVNLVANATLKIWKGLSFQGTYGYITSPGSAESYQDHKTLQMRKELLDFTVAPAPGSTPIYYLPATGGTLVSTNINQRNWTVRNQLVYNYSGRDGNDEVTLQGGQEANERISNRTGITVLGYDEDLQTSALVDYNRLSQGVFGTVGGAGFYSAQQYNLREDRSRFNSYFGLASYTLNRKYSLDGSWRVDHSNLFGSDVSAQNKPVYSFGAKWNLANENFMKPVTWVNSLAFRATYGITGNSPYVGAATTSDVLAQEQYTPYPLIAGKSYTVIQSANDKLSWEATHTINLGIDFAIFNSRLSGSLEYYHKNTTSLLGSVNLDPFTGQTTGTSNIGNLTNNGINIGLNSINIQSGSFRWSTGVVFAYNKNKLVTYSPPQSYQDIAAVRLFATAVLGYPVDPLFAYRYAGLDKVGDPQIKLADGTITKDPNAPTAKDLVYKGSIIPKFNGGISNSFRYRQFELSLNMVYSLGAVMRRDVNQFYSGRLSSTNDFGGNVSADFVNRWKKPGDENITDIPAYNSSGFYNYSQRNTQYYTMADINVVSASYLKLRETALAYSLDPRLLHWLKVQSITIRAQVNNILLWKANKYGIDPEYQQYQAGFRGVPSGQHAITLGANVNF